MGLATGLAGGVVTITASGSHNGTPYSATAELTVTTVTVESLQVTPEMQSIPAGLTHQFTATATLSDGSVIDVTSQAALSWSSSDVAVATISNESETKGLATGLASGTTIITASGSANGVSFTASAELTVTSATVTALQVTPPTANV